MKKAVVMGGNGFIGHHLARRLKNEGYWVRTVDILEYPYKDISYTDDYIIDDLKSFDACLRYTKDVDEVYQLAAWMGGAGVIFTGDYDAKIMYESGQINLNIVEACRINKVGKIFYSSSACMYPAYNQEDPSNPKCSEDSAYPAAPDSEYGWEKLFSERLYLSFKRNYGLNVKIARFHNIFGPEGSWNNGKEKAPAAMCRKVAMAKDNDIIEIWGDGEQTRSFLYIDECLEGIRRLMDSDFVGPVNIGSEEMVTINQLVKYVAEIAGKNISITHIDGPLGVRGRNSDNNLIEEKLGWAPNYPLRKGLENTYQWIKKQVESKE